LSNSRFVMPIAFVGACAYMPASSAARAGSVSSATTSDTSPHSRASAAESFRPDVIHSKDRAVPSSRWMKYVPPESGTSPMPMNAGTKLADSAAIRMSQAQASESPAPAAGPLTAAMTGFSSARMARTFRW
jgi:hypothetical protein